MGMNRLPRLARVLVCSWVLGGEEVLDLPTGAGVADRALELARADNALPAWFWQQVHFAQSRVGLICVELCDILDWAQTADLIEFSHPAQRRARVKVRPATARQMLLEIGVSVEEAASWGRTLRAASGTAIKEFAA
jgi:hypothetical protein